MTTRKAPDPSNRQILAEASEWFVEFRFDDTDADARKRFGEWLRRSPEHIQAYLEITESWANLPRNDPGGKIDVAGLIARARSAESEVFALRRPSERSVPAARAGAPRFRRGLLAAAVLLLCLIPLGLVWNHTRATPSYRTDVGEQRNIVLDDGSSIDLNARSEIRVQFSKTRRRIELLSGQALFKVAHDDARPFQVSAGNGTITAVGTEFDVYRKRGSTIVTVVEGKVALAPLSGSAEAKRPASPGAGRDSRPPSVQAGEIYLAAGEQAVFTAQAPLEAKPADVQAATAWATKKLVFDSVPLAEVADEFNRYNPRAIIVDDPEIAALAISGVYSSTDPTSLLRFLRNLPQIQVVESDREIRIEKKLR